MSKFSLSKLASQGFSQLAVEDLEKSGLSLETVKRMGLLPLTPETFKEYLHFSLVEKATREPIVLDGYVIPYPSPAKFGRLKVLKWNERSQYAQNRKELPKYLQPSSQHVENPLKLYHLPDVNVKSPKKIYFITEGEKKTAKLQQELEKIDEKFAALGLGGVWNWNETTFSEAGVSFRDRKVYLVFDADGKDNPGVARAELRLYGYLLSRGAVSVKSLVWDKERGKGIDDYLTGCESEVEELKNLLSSATSPIEKYKDTVSFQTVIEELAESLQELSSQLTEEIKKAYGVGKREIKRKFQEARERKRREIEERLRREEEEKLLEVYEKLFGIDFVPELPKGYRIENGLLYCGDEDVCNAFVVSKVKDNADEIDGGYVATLSFISGKKFEVDNNTVSSHKFLCRYFNKMGVKVSESETKRIQNYISKFIRLNEKKVKAGFYSSRIGWGVIEGEEVYVHPIVSTIDVLISRDIEEKLKNEGSLEGEKKVVKELFEKFPYAGLLYAMSVSVSVLKPLLKRDYNMVVLVQGESGSGKTTAIKGGVSFYAHPEFKRSFRFTESGFEHFVAKLKDFPIHLEEVRDLDKNPQRRVEKFNNFVYSFAGGDGKVRMNVDLTFRKMEEFRGVIFTSSEIGIDEILAYSSDSYRDGLKRRLLVVPADREKLGGEKLAKVVEKFCENHGNLLPVWLEYFNQNRREIEEKLKERIEDFKEGYSRLDAKFYRFLAVVSIVLDELEKLLGVDTAKVWTALEEVGAFNEEVYSGEENFKERVIETIKGLNKETLVEEEDEHGRVTKTLKEYKGDFFVYRRVRKEKYGETEEIVEEKNYLTSKGMDKLAELLGMSRNVLIRKLVEVGLLEESPEGEKRLCKREYKRILYEETKLKLFPINISLDRIEEMEEETEENFL